MKIQSYFASEKKGGYLALSIGLISCTIGFSFLLSAMPPFYVGLAIPLILFGGVELFAGATVARRRDFQAYDLQKLLGNDPEEFVSTESPRMGKVMRTFVILRWLEGVAVVIGVILILVAQDMVFTMGLGLGMLVHGAIMLVFDYFAEKRAAKYSLFVDTVLED